MNYGLNGTRLNGLGRLSVSVLGKRRSGIRLRVEDVWGVTLIILFGLPLDAALFLGATLANCTAATMDSFLRFLRVVLELGELLRGDSRGDNGSSSTSLISCSTCLYLFGLSLATGILNLL